MDGGLAGAAASGRRWPSGSRRCAASTSKSCRSRCSTSPCAGSSSPATTSCCSARRLGGAAPRGGRRRAAHPVLGAAVAERVRHSPRRSTPTRRGRAPRCSSSAAASARRASSPPAPGPRCSPPTARRTPSPTPRTRSRSTAPKPTSRRPTGPSRRRCAGRARAVRPRARRRRALHARERATPRCGCCPRLVAPGGKARFADPGRSNARRLPAGRSSAMFALTTRREGELSLHELIPR